MVKLNSLFVSVCSCGTLLGLLARRFDLMNEEFVANINQLRVDDPSVHLVVKDFVAGVENARVHVLNYRIARHAPLVEGFKQLATSDA